MTTLTPRLAVLGSTALAVVGAVTLTAGLLMSAQPSTEVASAPPAEPTTSPDVIEPTAEPTIPPGMPCVLEIAHAHGGGLNEAVAFTVWGEAEEAWGIREDALAPVCQGMTSMADLTLSAPEGPGSIGEMTGEVSGEATIRFYKSENSVVTVIAVLGEDGELLLTANTLPFPSE